ncbi:hypothetical protein KYN89_02415 [Alteriqipengyuania sp. NZ-12B]|uniref:Uncharacterized protein n=1 Tax=Alteriqipengyuania abyssalis TaxID=2860200 RepID=A0ABS7PA04_9SPHN|nr:hypothetical protein [Alteriqipengyuania abyssalis]MBY8335894.1 hypothetical protein [Alteriqipengyuania abyssalis]
MPDLLPSFLIVAGVPPSAGVLLDPASVLVGLGALVGLFAGFAWHKVWRSIDTSGEAVTGPDKRGLKDAAFLSMGAFTLTSAGYLFGVFFGRI